MELLEAVGILIAAIAGLLGSVTLSNKLSSRATAAALKTATDATNARIEDLEGQLRDEREESEQFRTGLNAERELTTTLQNRLDEVERARAQSDQAKDAEINKLRESQNSLIEEVAALRTQIKQLEANDNKKSDEIARLKDLLQTSEEKRIGQAAVIKELKIQLGTYDRAMTLIGFRLQDANGKSTEEAGAEEPSAPSQMEEIKDGTD